MADFIREVKTIKIILSGSAWGADPQTQTVLNELDEFIDARRLRHQNRKSSLQIFFSGRAIDTMLVHACDWERARLGLGPLERRRRSMGGAMTYINGLPGRRGRRAVRGNGINSNMFTAQVSTDFRNYVQNQRNSHFHQAGVFPSDPILQNFLTHATNALRQLAGWRP